jgi:hypothetical protein
MNVKFKRIREAGVPQKERIVFSVSADAEIGNYLVLITGLASDGSPFSGRHASFWFPDKKVKAGDLVVLYTMNGSAKSVSNEDGSSSHFFYWGLAETKLGKPQIGIVLLRASEWEKGVPSAEVSS